MTYNGIYTKHGCYKKSAILSDIVLVFENYLSLFEAINHREVLSPVTMSLPVVSVIRMEDV